LIRAVVGDSDDAGWDNLLDGPAAMYFDGWSLELTGRIATFAIVTFEEGLVPAVSALSCWRCATRAGHGGGQQAV